MRHSLIYRKAILIDALLDNYRTEKSLTNFPRKVAAKIVGVVFPKSCLRGRGWYKAAFKLPTRARDVVLKISDSKNIKADWAAYNQFPKWQRNRNFAKIYWTTKYCLLQKHGTKRIVSQAELYRLRRIGSRYNLCDIRGDNIRFVDGGFKIIDANLRVPKP
jgi:hypothetical protein